MHETTEKVLVVSRSGINYYTIFDRTSSSNRQYGILAESSDNADDLQAAENLFFTFEEAQNYCMWFAENEVCPITLREVLANIYHIEV